MHRVELSPSGREFVVEPGQTILEAALSSGLTVPYQCANGSCGDCRARVVEGRVAATDPHDYVFKGPDRQHPMLLMCASRPATDMILEAALVVSPRDIPHQQITARVKKKEVVGDDVLVLTLRTPRSNTLRFLAGQNVDLRIPGAGQHRKSIASCPCNGLELQFHFRRRPGDEFSVHLFDALQTSDTVEVEGPYGEMVFADDSPRPVILVAYDTGFSAMKSLIEHIISLETEQPVHLYWMIPKDVRAYLSNQCRAWADAVTNFRCTEIPSPDPLPVIQAIAANHGGLEEHDIYLSVPGPACRELRALLLESGARPERIRWDALRHR